MNGLIYFNDVNGNQIKINDAAITTVDIATSSDEVAPILCNLTSFAECSFETKFEHLDFDVLLPSKFTVSWETPILIQARWHKKARINKKWLKRYGVKNDTVKVTAKVNQLNYNTHVGDWDFELKDYKRILKPHQMAKGRMIWWSAR